MNMQTRLDSLRLATRLGWSAQLPVGASEHARQEFEADAERARTSPGDATLPGILQRAAEQSDWSERDVHGILERAATTPSSAVCELLTSTVQAGIGATFLGTADPTAGLATEVDLLDFRVNKRAILVGERLAATARGAEFKEVAFPATLEETRLFRFGGQFFLDEQEIAGDRVGFLSAAVESITRSCGFVKGDLVASVLLANADLRDEVPLFDADHANLGVGVLGKDTLAAALCAMALQVGPDGAPLNVRGRTLLVPPALEGAAREAIRALEIQDASPEMRIGLKVDARLSIGVTDPRDATAYEGSQTAWFLFADPLQAPVLEMCFLQGTNRTPVARSWNPDRGGQWGVGFSIAFDVGCTALGFRGAYMSSGAGS